MYDIRKRTGFQTVGELRAMLNHLPANTRVSICGDANCFYHEKRDGSLICLDCEELREHYEETLEALLAKEAPAERDKHLEALWAELADVPMNPETETMEAPFHIFPEGTHREDLWHWFDAHHSRGVAYLLNGTSSADEKKEDPLTLFIQQEVPVRLREILQISPERITDALVGDCVEALDNDSDILFNYDRIDDKLWEILKEHGVEEEE